MTVQLGDDQGQGQLTTLDRDHKHRAGKGDVEAEAEAEKGTLGMSHWVLITIKGEMIMIGDQRKIYSKGGLKKRKRSK